MIARGGWAGLMTINAKHAEVLTQQLGVLVVDDNPFMRKMVRSMLNNIGVKRTLEAADRIAGARRVPDAGHSHDARRPRENAGASSSRSRSASTSSCASRCRPRPCSTA